MTVANFKEQLYHIKEVKKANITKMNIYKVELELDSLEDDKTYTKDDINGTIMKPGHDLNEYFNDAEKKPKKGHLHIFIIPTPTGKCLPTFYFSNKKFAVIKYRVWSDLLFFYLFLATGQKRHADSGMFLTQ
ncbi:hypothetical protein RhiirC2_238636 [Rhizophagus irregularis]|uniref:Uncharacterized protein n=1 Tax=Rhizophagus irregularis TaxID=588596 RepID=A0A2N1MGI5_9GLOM|nr:hypothetical protein RhiirC2_238636 [Rhizophagus irregularis]